MVAGLRVGSPIAHALHRGILGLLKDADERRLDSQLAQEADLTLGLREAVENPSVDLAVGHLESLLN